MTGPHLPSSLADPATLPPPLLTSEPGSFAQHTLAVRVPHIVEETIELNDFSEEIRSALAGLRLELLNGTAQPLRENTPDRDFWNSVSAPYLGRSWLDVPWYWAEAYFYRRVLEATDYFQPGMWQGIDPFAPTKRTEWEPQAAPHAVERLLAALPEDPYGRFAALLQGSLWGNRIDLSYKYVMAQFAGAGAAPAEQADLLIDHTQRVWTHLHAAPLAPHPSQPPQGQPVEGAGQAPQPGRITLVADNAGTELALDLALIDFLLAERLAGEVHLHLKLQPFFVSDAMPADLAAGLAAMPAGGPLADGLASRLRGYFASGRLQIRTHWLYVTSLHYFQMPADLNADLSLSHLVIFKGDANYRRLLGDAHWPPTTSFAAAAGYFPAPLVALRTLKSELITGLPDGQAELLQRVDPRWLVNGKRGVIQATL